MLIVTKTIATLMLVAVPAAALAQAAAPQNPPVEQGAAPPTPPPLPGPAPTPPPLPQPNAVTFYIERNGQPVGPLTLDQVKQEIANGTVKQETLTWKPGEAAWRQAKDVAELKQLLAALPPPVPPEQRWRQFLVGTWQQTSTPFADVTRVITAQYRADGTVAGMVNQTMQGVPGVTQAFAGTWTVQAISGEQFTLTVSLTGQAPATSSLRRVDDNTVSDDTKGLEAHRIGP